MYCDLKHKFSTHKIDFMRVLVLNKPKEFIFLLTSPRSKMAYHIRRSHIALIFFGPLCLYSICQGDNFIDCLKFEGKEIVRDLKKDFFPSAIKSYYNISCDKWHHLSLRAVALVFLASNFGIKYIPALLESSLKKGFAIPNLVQLSEYTNPDYRDLAKTVQKMGLNPGETYAGECDSPRIAPNTAAATRTYNKKILLIDKDLGKRATQRAEYKLELTPGERRFMMGHEFTHLSHEHTLKSMTRKLVTPWLTRGALIVSNTLIFMGLRTIADKYNVNNTGILSSSLNIMQKLARFLLRNSWLEMLYCNRVETYYCRSLEKQADIESARRLGCAEDDISLMGKFNRLHSTFSKLIIRLNQFFDEHPTNAERMAYLRQIMEEKKAKF